MSGSPALGGTQPTSTSGLGDQIETHGITNDQPGVNSSTAGDMHHVADSVYRQLCRLKWSSTKGSKLEYGMSGRIDGILGLKHTVIGGFKTGLDIAWSRTYDVSSYRSLNVGFKYEAIVGKKEEIVHGRKQNNTFGVKEIAREQGARTDTHGAKLEKKQRLFKSAVDDLLQEFGTELAKTTQKYEAKIKTLNVKAGQMREAFGTKLAEKCGQMHVSMKSLEENIKKIEMQCQEFELKAGQIDNAVDSALKIRTPSSKIKGSMIEIKASVQKFLADVVKLGE